MSDFIRQRLPNAKIGLFLHTPWPSSEIYRSLPVRDELLRCLMSNDWIGFQTFGHSRHFMSACMRILGLTSNEKGIEWNSVHSVSTEVIPVGINPDQFIECLKLESVQQRIEELKERYKGKKIIVSRDGMEYINGIPHKLRSFRTFLQNYPEWKEKVVLFQHCRPNTDYLMNLKQYTDFCEEIEKLVGGINGEFGDIQYMPIVYLNQQLSWEETVAMFAVADVALLTPYRDGMNITAFEFTACQSDKKSPIILSEFAGAAGCFSGALIVNPWHEKKVSKAIYTALTMTVDVKEIRHQHNYNYVINHTAMYWMSQCLEHISASKLPKMDEAKILPINDLKIDFSKSNKRLFFLDYDGTLAGVQKLPHMAVPSKETMEVLKKLCSDTKNLIYIISGRDRKFLEEWFSDLRIGLAAEHGNFIRKCPEQFGVVSSWEEKGSDGDLSWRQPIKQIFDNFCDLTPGSLVEEKEINLTWHYRGADPGRF